jgi:hypothetical protein
VAGTPAQPRRRKHWLYLLIASVYYTVVSGFIAWILLSVGVHLMRSRGPLRQTPRISARAENPREVFQCYFDTWLLFDAMLDDFGRIAANQRCMKRSVKQDWGSIYAWDTHPWSVVDRGDQLTEESVGVWRYRLHEVWSRCRLNDTGLLERSRVLGSLALVHQDLDDLRRALTRQMRDFARTSDPLVERIRRRLAAADAELKQPQRLLREKRLVKWRLRQWGIHRTPPAVCKI